MISLTCSAGRDTGEKSCLAAEGFGNRMCFLQPASLKVFEQKLRKL